MTVKALKKQLMAAIAMVVVSAIALSSSTYAWFVGQNTVKADGLTIQAQSEAGILISHKHDNATNDVWASTAQGSFTSAQSLLPTSTADGTKWYHASAVATNDHTATAGSMVTLTNIEDAKIPAASTASVAGAVGTLGGKQYYIMDQFDIYTTGTSASNLKLSNVEVANAGGDLDKSLRLLIDAGGTKYVVAPVSGADLDYTVGVNADNETSSGTPVEPKTVEQIRDISLAGTVSPDKTEPTTVTVYVYYEGEDDNHYTDHKNDHQLAVSLTFEAEVVGN